LVNQRWEEGHAWGTSVLTARLTTRRAPITRGSRFDRYAREPSGSRHSARTTLAAVYPRASRSSRIDTRPLTVWVRGSSAEEADAACIAARWNRRLIASKPVPTTR
jgi:hypothetical protein